MVALNRFISQTAQYLSLELEINVLVFCEFFQAAPF